MCLRPEFFLEAEHRKYKWELNGLPLEEVESMLATYHSTVYPIAYEAAEFVAQHWSIAKLLTLSNESINIFMKITADKTLS